jgi:hypothetical protein
MTTRDIDDTTNTGTGSDQQHESARVSKSNVEGQQSEVDDFGLPKKPVRFSEAAPDSDEDEDGDTFHDVEITSNGAEHPDHESPSKPADMSAKLDKDPAAEQTTETLAEYARSGTSGNANETLDPDGKGEQTDTVKPPSQVSKDIPDRVQKQEDEVSSPISPRASRISEAVIPKRDNRSSNPIASEWSHQRHISTTTQSDDDEEEEWQAMPAIDEFDVFDDDGRLVAKGHKEDALQSNAYAGIGGAGKGYTRLQLDEDAQSATSMDEDTNYLFKGGQQKPADMDDLPVYEEDDQRDALTQLEATKDLLTESQRIAYVGVTRLTIHKMFHALGDLERTRSTRKELMAALESMNMWGQKMMVRLYAHMDISQAEQIMIEQLAEHGVEPSDLSAPLMLNARVKNPLAEPTTSDPLETKSDSVELSKEKEVAAQNGEGSTPHQEDEDVPEYQEVEELPHTKEIDLDLRWTVLCDLFLVLISDGQYDSRSRRLLERVGSTMDISWTQICRFEKRVMDALEMQEAEAQENWDESDHMENRRKKALKRKYVFMGLATVGGGLVIGLSAGLLAPVIGAGLAAGFTTIGVTGTAGFLGGIGGAAIITSASTAAGGIIAIRAADRRTGSVRTFEYRPLHNNKRLNLILTVSGWMTGKVDDVRLPYSTVDPIMGDIYSLLWEPDMLRSMGDTINILANEALTQTVQQILGYTILTGLMAALQLPVVLSKLAYLIDNPWSVSLDRAHAAGLILADSLIDRHLGQRPITLVGFSLGSTVIYSCLKELSNRGAYGLIQNVYMFGSPVVVNKDDWHRARSVVSGRFLNGYAGNDWILGYLFRMTSGGIMRVAGLAPVEGIPGVENVNVGPWVNGHMSYRAAMPRLLREVGWEVESDEFTEIEDPDPEDHAKRQRELIAEIDEARKKAEEKPDKKRFGLFRKGKTEKKGWETYNAADAANKKNNGKQEGVIVDSNVLFDVEAIRRELAGEMVEVRELDSTLPPMQITSMTKDGEKHVEYLRLPPGMKPEELERLNLPPRPDQIEMTFEPVKSPPPNPQRSSSFMPAFITSPKLNNSSPQRSPQRSPQPSIAESRRSSYTYSEPKELVSTLPPLNLTPMVSPNIETLSTTTTLPVRSSSRAPATDPINAPSWSRPTTPVNHDQGKLKSRELSRPPEVNLEKNAWANDDGDEFGQCKGEPSMTFE